MTINRYDVLIVGSGLVGATLACALATTAGNPKITIALVEPRDLRKPQARPPSFDGRSSVLAYGTRLIYETLGLWTALAPHVAPIHQIHVSDQDHFGVTRFDHTTEQVPALGYVVDNHALGDTLLQRLLAYHQDGIITLYSPATVCRLTPTAQGMTATLAPHTTQAQQPTTKLPSSLQASLVVLADGGRSGLLAQLGIDKTTQAYQQQALVANVAVDQPHDGIAYERFSRQGPIALLPKRAPTEQHRTQSATACYGLVWTLPDAIVDAILELDDNAFLARLQQCFGYPAGRFLQIGHRHCYPLTQCIAKEQVRSGLVILGNAARSIHPVAGQGYNLAVRDVLALTRNIHDSVQAGLSPGQLQRLLRYWQQRTPDQSRAAWFCDQVVKLFASNSKSVILARNLGLLGLDNSPPLKSRFARLAMGL